MNTAQQHYQDAVERMEHVGGIDEHGRINVDGFFSADELRAIANLLELGELS